MGRRRAPLKLLFSLSKEIIIATTAGLIISSVDVELMTTAGQLDHFPPIEMLALAFGAMVLLDHLVSVPVIAISQGNSVLAMYGNGLNRHLALSVVRFGVALVALWLFYFDSRLLLAVPPLVLSLHLAYSSRVRNRAEREAWQRLARTTDALNVVDLDKVLTTAVTQAAELFSADEVEIELRDGGRTVRGAAGTSPTTGPPTSPARWTDRPPRSAGGPRPGRRRRRAAPAVPAARSSSPNASSTPCAPSPPRCAPRSATPRRTPNWPASPTSTRTRPPTTR